MTDSRQLEILDAGLMAYADALALQKRLVADKIAGDTRDFLVLVEHPPVITLGRTARAANLLLSRPELARRGIEAFDVERGGDVTLHAPGQLVGYPVVDLKRAGLGVTDHLRFLERVIIDTLAGFRIDAFTRKGLTGVWTASGKIAAIGVAVRRWISFHGFALNVNTDLSLFNVIVPCGLSGEKVASMAGVTGAPVDISAVREAVVRAFSDALFALQSEARR